MDDMERIIRGLEEMKFMMFRVGGTEGTKIHW